MLWQARQGFIAPSVAALSPAAGGGGGGDPYFSNVVLLAGFDGTNGATAFTDESSPGHGAGTFSGSAALSTARAQFGSASLLLAASGGVMWPDSANWVFGSGSYTIECWIYPTTVSGIQFIVGQWDVDAFSFAFILWLNGTALKFNQSNNGSSNNTILSGATVTANTWHHVAMDYDTSKFRLYYDGTTVSTLSTGLTGVDIAKTLAIGVDSSGNNFGFSGNIDEVRITKGVARYATDTSFTVPTSSFPRS